VELEGIEDKESLCGCFSWGDGEEFFWVGGEVLGEAISCVVAESGGMDIGDVVAHLVEGTLVGLALCEHGGAEELCT